MPMLTISTSAIFEMCTILKVMIFPAAAECYYRD